MNKLKKIFSMKVLLDILNAEDDLVQYVPMSN